MTTRDRIGLLACFLLGMVSSSLCAQGAKNAPELSREGDELVVHVRGEFLYVPESEGLTKEDAALITFFLAQHDAVAAAAESLSKETGVDSKDLSLLIGKVLRHQVEWEGQALWGYLVIVARMTARVDVRELGRHLEWLSAHPSVRELYLDQRARQLRLALGASALAMPRTAERPVFDAGNVSSLVHGISGSDSLYSALFYLESADYEEALKRAALAAEQVPELDCRSSLSAWLENSDFYLANAQVQITQREFDAALASLNKAIQLSERNVKAVMLRARLLYAARRFDQALVDFSSAIAINPELPEPYAGRANIYMRSQRDYPRAVEDFNSFLRLGGAQSQDAEAIRNAIRQMGGEPSY